MSRYILFLLYLLVESLGITITVVSLSMKSKNWDGVSMDCEYDSILHYYIEL